MLTHGCRALVAQYRRDLEAELQRREVGQGIERLRETYPVFARYPSVETLTALVRPRNPAYEDKDTVLGILLGQIQTDKARTLFPLLNRIFWGSLLSIFGRKRRDCPNPADLFSRILVEFVQVAVTYPLARRPRKIDANLYLDTWKKVTAWQREEAQYREQYEPLRTCMKTLKPPV